MFFPACLGIYVNIYAVHKAGGASLSAVHSLLFGGIPCCTFISLILRHYFTRRCSSCELWLSAEKDNVLIFVLFICLSAVLKNTDGFHMTINGQNTSSRFEINGKCQKVGFGSTTISLKFYIIIFMFKSSQH